MRTHDGSLGRSLLAPQAEVESLHGRLRHMEAEYRDYRKRAQRDLEESRIFANEGIVKALLPVLDDLDRASDHAEASLPPDDPFLGGLKEVRARATAVLGGFGVTCIESLNRQFDPLCHHAVDVARDDSGERPPRVVKELLKGYALNGRIIRPAMVVVSLPSDERGLPATSS